MTDTDIVAAIHDRLAKLDREFVTAAKIDYCRFVDSPENLRELERVLKEYPEWRGCLDD